MNVSCDWLRAFVPFRESAPALRALLTTHTATVDELVPLRADLEAIVVARVVEEAPHPDSDHLHVTKVDAGTGVLLDVVCGAPNVAAGRMYPFARTGTVLPGGLKIQKRKIRGAVSDGMLCSARELDLGAEQDGIMELDLDVPPGTPLLQAMPLGDMQLVLDVLANRPDLLAHLGVAREVAALTGLPFALPAIDGMIAAVPPAIIHPTEARASSMSIRIDEPDLVNRFMGVVIRGVTVGPSPEWLVRRLEAVGSRSINNVVDASNYVLHELGQPTHAFDIDTLAESSLVVRLAHAGERITTLDGVERALRHDMIVIADAARPQAVAGVMGGRDSEVTSATKNVFVEVANFNPSRIRQTRKALGLSTEASYRFERGVDLEIGPRALERVAQLIVAIAGGAIDGSPVDLGYEHSPSRTIVLRTGRVARVIGDPLDRGEIATILTSVGFGAVSDGEDLRVTVPSWRGDVTEEVNLIEEVARLRGYDSFSTELRAFRPGSVGDDAQWVASRRLRESLVALGMLEARPLPFVAGGPDFVRLANPMSEAEACLRREVVDTLARRAEYNLARMQGNIRLFEIGSVFLPGTGELPREELHAGALVMGRRQPPHFTDPKSEEFSSWASYDEWDAKGLGLSIAQASYPGATVAANACAGESLWCLTADGSEVGFVRRMRLDAPPWAASAFGIEVSLGKIDSAPVAEPGHAAHRPFERARGARSGYQPLPTTPASEIDIALLVSDGVAAERVEAVIRRICGKLLERLDLFDRYVGPGVDPGHRSLAWRLTFRHAERTLRDREIDARRSDILRALADELNVRQRTH